MRVTVIGCGYLGTTHAACLAEMGHEVLAVEIDPQRRHRLQEGHLPFYEPGLEQLLSKHTANGSLRFTDSYQEAAEFAVVHFLCVGTPQQESGLGADLTQIESAISSLAPRLRPGALIVGKCTVPVGTAEALAQRVLDMAPVPNVALAWNPEFLREGRAVDDSLRPDRLVFGVASPAAEDLLRRIYAGPIADGCPVVVTDFPTAELVKGAANAFLATKISFINAIAEVCEAAGADVRALADALGHDERIGRSFLNAGVGFGGGCLPKDIRAFVHRAGELGVEDAMSFLREVDAINQRQRQRVLDMAKSALAQVHQPRVTVLGAAFKPHSDDVRDSPALWIAGQLYLAGAEVCVHDPEAIDTARRRFPTLKYASDPLDACRDADLVLHLTEWPEYRELDPDKVGDVVARRVVIDGRNKLDDIAWREAGWEFRGIGR
ncbi:UDP-glucose/GDP-mannose dehydrogenase family protein [Nocardioides guangzhouensis]|uniref:UDP-glucose 6-dehydrogenase n=1 Tax=Nocardioides guangzhouensis TaxID=2497878 RepID=A0A4Q4Z9M9_9ACTN|nr:UDP-glucose/GDP-mannose dehydrogenase family protein [Nocardioides guangzhouensis]RYP83876.1 UDP-glucose/GDP-mannose dehydrogenase family protein [Nocardioides guangzhouensis]